MALNAEECPALLQLTRLALAVTDLDRDRPLQPACQEVLQQLAAILQTIQDKSSIINDD